MTKIKIDVNAIMECDNSEGPRCPQQLRLAMSNRRR